MSALSAPSCGLLLRTDDYRSAPAVPDASETGTIRYSAGECGACMQGGCSSEIARCEQDEPCTRYAQCQTRCGLQDGACLYRCASLLEQKSEVANRFIACELRKCPAQCWSCGGIFSGITQECATCAIDDPGDQGLCALTNACLLDAGCNAYVSCTAEQMVKFGTTDPAARLYCGSQYSKEARAFYVGPPPAPGVGTRYFFGCTEPCSAGRNWDCKQPAAWPAPSGERAVVTLVVPVVASDSGVSRVFVRACPGTDYECKNPVGEHDTDESGSVSFDVNQASSEAAYYFELYDAGSSTPFMVYCPRQPVIANITLWVPGRDDYLSLDAAAAVRHEARSTDSGVVHVNVADCVGGNADFNSADPQVVITGPPGVSEYYVDRLGSFDALAKAAGTADFINVPSGTLSVSVQHGTNPSTLVGTAVVPVRAGAMTFVTFNYPQYY